MTLAELARNPFVPPPSTVSWETRAVPTDRGSLSAREDDDLAHVLKRIGTVMHVARNRTIFNEGDRAEHAYRLVSGVVRLCKHMADGRRQIVQFLFPGDFFSFMELQGHQLSAEAVSDVVMTCYFQRQIAQLGKDMPEVREHFLNLLWQRLLRMQDHLIMLGRQTASERVATFLVLLAERIGTSKDKALEVAMSRQDMADYLGLTIETVCRILSKLKRRKIIDVLDLHTLVLRNVSALHAIAEGGAK
jgi:CRP-like cAMP-binding protein